MIHESDPAFGNLFCEKGELLPTFPFPGHVGDDVTLTFALFGALLSK
jgi:hypothetical protein